VRILTKHGASFAHGWNSSI